MLQHHSWRYKLLTLVFVFPFLAFAQENIEGNKNQADTTGNGAARAAFGLMNSAVQSTQDKIESSVADSTKSDSLISPSALKNLVNYYAEDSMQISVQLNKAYLYNAAHIDYGDVTLDAGYIELDWAKNEVYAHGILDSTGKMSQQPVFKQGEDTYETDEIRYNFSSNKAIIKTVITREGESYLHGEVIKRQDESTFYIQGTAFTTCNKRHPDFFVATKKAKVIVGKKIITGPANLVIADIPTPIILPFGFFPAQDKRSSGFIIPTFNQHIGKGLGLVNGGYYFSLSDYYDLTLTGEVYSRGGFGLQGRSTYKKRYKYSGNIIARYNHTIIGDPRYDDYSSEYINSKDFKFHWDHQQDAKARPDLRFGASVDLTNPTFNKYNTVNSGEYLQNTTTSSISLDKRWLGTPFSMAASANHSQNNISKNFTLSLPKVAFTMSRINPFERRNGVGKKRWYEKIGTNYTGATEAQLRGNYDSLSNGSEQFNNILRTGMQHNVGVSTSERVFTYFSINPSVQYTSKWYRSKLDYQYNDDNQLLVDTISGFALTNEFSASVDLSTKLYGTFNYRKGKIKAIRHMMTPTIGMSYRPDYSDDFWGSYQHLTDTSGKEVVISRFNGYLYGGNSAGKSGLITMSLGNNLEMKVRSDKDSTGERKVKILDRLNFNTNYNMAATEFNWSNLGVVAQSSVLKNKVQLSYQGVFDFYGYDPTLKKRVNKSAYEVNNKIVRNTSSTFSVNMKWQGNLGVERKKKENKSVLGIEDGDINYYSVTELMDFSMPWNFSINYNYQLSKSTLDAVVTTHAIGFNAGFDPTPNWHILVNSGFDIVEKEITYTQLNIVRDLHCWELRLMWVPFGFNQSYMVGINIKASSFKDAKLERRRNQGDF